MTEGSNLYFTNARAIEAAKDAYSGGTGVTYDRDTIGVSIGQAVETTSAVQFGSVQVDDHLEIDTVTTTTTDTAEVAIDTSAIADMRSAVYSIQVTSGTDYQSSEILVLHDDTTASIVEFGALVTGNDLATFDVDVNAGNVRLLATPASSTSTVFKLSKKVVGDFS